MASEIYGTNEPKRPSKKRSWRQELNSPEIYLYQAFYRMSKPYPRFQKSDKVHLKVKLKKIYLQRSYEEKVASKFI